MKDLLLKQQKLIKKVKFFFKDKKLSDEKIARLDLFYLCPFASFKGSSKLIYFFDKILSYKIYLMTSLKDFIKLFFLGELKTINIESKKKNYKKVVVNWGTLKNFSKNGDYYDKHLNISSNQSPETLWYIIYMDNTLPKSIKKNIVIVFKNKNKLTLRNIKLIFRTIFEKKTLQYINQEISEISILANYVSKDFSNIIHKNLKKVVMPYEGQPFQNSIFMKIHSINKDIETFGYIHSFPIGLPANLMLRAGHPKKIIVNSKAKQYCLKSYFGWEKKNILILPSARLTRNTKFQMKNKIFLPIQFRDKEHLLAQIKNLVFKKDFNLFKFKVKNHPSCLNSVKHLKLVKEIKKITVLSKHNKHYDKDLSIFIGTTGSVIEALERNIKVVHICEIPILEAYTKKIWKYLKCIKIEKNIFKYEKIKNQYLLNFGKSQSLYKRYL